MKKLCVCLLAALLFAGCSTTTPKDYWQDTTPGHSGAQWIGGE